MPPEQKVRQEIHRQLQQAGWFVQSQAEMNIFAGLGVAVRESQPQTLLRLWQVFGTVTPNKVDTGSGKHCKHIVDLVALVRHAIDPDSPLRPVGMTVEERFTEWLSDQQSSGGEFTDEQMQWLVAIKDHIASSLMIEQDDFEYAPFNQFGGIGRAYELFGKSLKLEMSLAS